MKRFLLPILLLVVLFSGLGAGIWLLTSRASESASESAAPTQTSTKPAS